MRLLYVFVICVIAYGHVFAADLLPFDKDGFGGIRWGTEFSSVDKLGMKECADYGRKIVCTKSNENLKEIGGVPVDVMYSFDGGYLYDIIIRFDDALQWPAITNALTKAYGKSEHEFNGFWYEKNIKDVYITGHYFQEARQRLIIRANNTKHIDFVEADTNRLDRVALSAFTGVERNSLEGLLGAKWGMTVDQLPHKVLLAKAFSYDDGTIKYYIQIENLCFGSISVKSVEYEFKNDMLREITIYVGPYPEILREFHSDLADFLVKVIELNFGKMTKTELGHSLRLPKTIVHVGDSLGGGVTIRAYKRWK